MIGVGVGVGGRGWHYGLESDEIGVVCIAKVPCYNRV